MVAPRAQAGGSFAPDIDEVKLQQYKQLAATCEDRKCAGYMNELIAMVEKFKETPESNLDGEPHPSGVGTIVPLEAAEMDRIFDLVPWMEECDLMGRAFDALTGAVRDAAYHLLWFARELTLDREPLTLERIGKAIKK